jgi:hypothetical protein
LFKWLRVKKDNGDAGIAMMKLNEVPQLWMFNVTYLSSVPGRRVPLPLVPPLRPVRMSCLWIGVREWACLSNARNTFRYSF